MKKLVLMLMLVLGLTPCVWAILLPIELSVNGVYNGPNNVTEVTIAPCQYLDIGVQGALGLDWQAYLIIEGVFPNSAGEWGDNFLPVMPLNSGFYYADEMYPLICPGAGQGSLIRRYTEEGWGFGYEIVDATLAENPAGTAFELRFHCVAAGDVTISLYSAEGDYITPDDRIIVYQNPEPATFMLLGLGAVILRRKR